MQDILQEQNQDFGFISLTEAAAMVGINVITLREYVANGELTAVDLGKGLKTTRPWLQALIDRRTINPEMATSGK